ncbi:MAG TPA: NADH-quinone oxidoreductase subunit J [Solirubrobacterales bacterium]|nr:NADH-quinone oxidoreductase subunit J [Solirubrobacterales bacterium]
MLFEQILFFLAAAGALAGAVGVVALRNPFFSVLALVGHLLALAVLFLLLRAEFVAAAQVVVYAGAVMVLYVFVVAYLGGSEEPLGPSLGAVRAVGPLFAVALLAEIAIATVATGLKAAGSRGPEVAAGFGSPQAIGALLMEKFLIAFEAASFLLLLAAVAAVVLAGRRRGLEEAGGERVLQLGRRPETGPQATDRSAGDQGGYGGRAIDKPASAARGGQSA